MAGTGVAVQGPPLLRGLAWEVVERLNAADGFYGLGGVSFSTPPNVLSRVGTAESGDYGRNVASFS